MEKSVHTEEYAVFLQVLRDARIRAKITQADLASRLGQSQSFVSKFERGETRLDIVQTREICRELGISLTTLVRRFEDGVRDREERE